MQRKLLTEIPVLLVFFSLITACEQPTALSSDATVSSVLIGEVQAQSLGTPNTDWMAVTPGDVYLSHSQLANARVSVNADSGAKIYYAKGAEGAQPYFAEDSVLSLEHDDLVWLEVFSANLDQYLIYAVRVHNRTPVLSNITLVYQYPGQPYNVPHSYGLNLGTPGASLDDPALVSGEIWYGKTQENSDLTVTALPEMNDSVVVISGETDSGGPDFETPVTVTAVDGSYFYIRSANDQEQGETIYYKIKLVQKNDDLSLDDNKVVINSHDAAAGLMGAHSLVGQEAWGNYNDGAVLAPGGNVSIGTESSPISVAVTLTSPSGVTVEYSHTSNNLDYLADDEKWSSNANLGNLPKGEYVVLRLTSELGIRGWYKFRISYGKNEAVLTSITVGGVNATVSSLTAEGGSYGGTPGTVTLTSTQAGDGSQVTVAAVASEGATVRYNWGGSMAFGGPPAYYVSDAPWNTTGGGLFAGGSFFYGFVTVAPGVNNALVFIEVTSEDRLTVNTYAVSCTVSN